MDRLWGSAAGDGPVRSRFESGRSLGCSPRMRSFEMGVVELAGIHWVAGFGPECCSMYWRGQLTLFGSHGRGATCLNSQPGRKMEFRSLKWQE